MRSACWADSPSARAAIINSRANSGSLRSLASPSFQSWLRRGIFSLHVIHPQNLCPADVLCLRCFITAAKQNYYRSTVPPEIKAITRTEVEPGLEDPTTDTLSIAKISQLEARDPSLNSCGNRSIKRPQPHSKGVIPSRSKVFFDGDLGVHDRFYSYHI